MTAEEMWARFAGKGQLQAADFEAWAFGTDPDELAALVLTGVKTGTSSAYALYDVEHEPLPRAGEYSVILDGKDEAVCIIRTKNVTVLPYRDVTEHHAFLEGEGDRTLSYWRSVHEPFFRDCLSEAGLSFGEDMLVVYEEFEKVYP